MFHFLQSHFLLLISIHASAKEATRNIHTKFKTIIFQSTPPRRRRRLSSLCSKIFARFQSTPPRRRRRYSRKKYNEQNKFQSTPPRRRRLTVNFCFGLGRIISIHASAKEATATYCNTPAIMCISSLNNFFVHHF